MAGDVKRGDLRAARVADTEARLLRAATALFLQVGYPATTLAAVAARAGVAERTVYVRFGTKAALLRRATDVAVAGDALPIDVAGRPLFQLALSAPTLGERLDAMAAMNREIMARAGGLLAVAFEAAAGEPLLAEAAQAGRLATRDHVRTFWRQAAADGLLPAGADVDWLGDTCAVLAAAETYQLVVRTLAYDLDAYHAWLRGTFARLVDAASQPPGT